MLIILIGIGIIGILLFTIHFSLSEIAVANFSLFTFPFYLSDIAVANFSLFTFPFYLSISGSPAPRAVRYSHRWHSAQG